MRRNRVLVAALAVVVGLVVLVTGGTWVYINVIEGDPPSKLTLEPGGAGPATTTAGGMASTEPASSGPVEGTWNVTAGSQAGYRVKETLFGQSTEAVGRTDRVTGSIVLAGTTVSSGSFTVDLTTVSSDRTQRDGQCRGRIMDTATYPTATFTLTQPIDLGSTSGDAPAAAKATEFLLVLAR
ncbi:MAG: YceI family protein [Acidimicrobiales bacterium]